MRGAGSSVLALVLLLQPAAARPEEEAAPPPAPPFKVRLRMADDRILSSELVRVQERALVIRPLTRIPQAETIVRVDDIRYAEWSRGKARGRAAGKGALIGALVGVALALLEDVACHDYHEGGDQECLGGGGLAVAVATVPVAAGLGAAAGAVFARDQWTPLDLRALPVSPPTELPNRPAPGRPLVGLRFRF